MATELERRINGLEAARAAHLSSRPFAHLTVEELRAELQRLDSGLPPSEAALAIMARLTKGDANDES